MITLVRPTCPDCKRLAVFVNSHESGGLRIRSFGCKRCGKWSLGTLIDSGAGVATVSKIPRNKTGRFAFIG